MYILDCLHDGLSEDHIIKNCDGDAQLVKIWMDFLKDNRWVIKDEPNHRWLLTDKGMRQMASYYQV
jgi:predicted transcriptional regulator